MSTGTVRRVSRQDIQLVQNLIERCLQLYMNEKEVVDTLLVQAKIEPGFTELVWQKLEEENREFFQAYYLRLRVKHQILEFNKLLEQQVQLMRQLYPTGVASLPTTNGTHTSHLQPRSSSYNPEPEKIQHLVGPTIPNPYLNGGSSLHNMQHPAMGMSVHASRVIDPPPNMISSQSSDMCLMQGLNLNGGMVKTEVGYSGGSAYMFGADNSILESRSTMGDASSIGPFNTVESTSQPLHDPLLDADTNSFGFLDQIPRNLSLSDLTAFSQTSDILESYARSPFLATDGDHFLDVGERGEQGEDGRLDPISEGLSYDDFGSE